MTPAELRPIVWAWGGPEKFARLLGVSTRTVGYWLAGQKRVSAPVSQLIRLLYAKPPATDAAARQLTSQQQLRGGAHD